MQTDKKIWGNEIFWVNNKNYSSKILLIKEGKKTEKIFAKKRNKSIIILQGIVQLNIENISKILQEGETYDILPNIIHQIIAIKGDATIIEVGTQYDEKDLVVVEV